MERCQMRGDVRSTKKNKAIILIMVVGTLMPECLNQHRKLEILYIQATLSSFEKLVILLTYDHGGIQTFLKGVD